MKLNQTIARSLSFAAAAAGLALSAFAQEGLPTQKVLTIDVAEDYRPRRHGAVPRRWLQSHRHGGGRRQHFEGVSAG